MLDLVLLIVFFVYSPETHSVEKDKVPRNVICSCIRDFLMFDEKCSVLNVDYIFDGVVKDSKKWLGIGLSFE